MNTNLVGAPGDGLCLKPSLVTVSLHDPKACLCPHPTHRQWACKIPIPGPDHGRHYRELVLVYGAVGHAVVPLSDPTAFELQTK